MAKDFLGGLFDDLTEQAREVKQRTAPKPEKGVPLRGRYLDGSTYYVRLDDICDLLKINGVLPNTEAMLRRKATRQ